MGEIGKVVKIDNNNLTVIIERNEACSKCRACSVGISGTEMMLIANNNCDAKLDDSVNIELAENKFLFAVFMMYGVPFLSLVFGIIIGTYVASLMGYDKNKELIGFFVGIILIFVVYVIIKLNEDKWKNKNMSPVATKVVNNNNIS